MKTTITLREFGSSVYFLSSKGFKKGTIKRALVISENKSGIEVVYRVTCPDYGVEYMGDEKKPSELFDSFNEMITFYANQKI